MNLIETWGTKVWSNASSEGLMRYVMNEPDGGQLEQLEQQVRALSEIVARLIESSGKTDEQVLKILGIHGWTIDNDSGK